MAAWAATSIIKRWFAIVFSASVHTGAFLMGGVQSRNVLSTMAMSFVLLRLATLVWVTFGFSLAFSDGGAFQSVVGHPFCLLIAAHPAAIVLIVGQLQAV